MGLSTRQPPSSTEGTPTPSLARIESVARAVILARTQLLAYNGHLEDAARMLSAAESTDAPDCPSLDLLARIRAQQGRYQDAAMLWERVLGQDPANKEAIAGYEAALAMTPRRRFLRTSALGALLIVGIATLGISALLVVRPNSPLPSPKSNAANAGLDSNTRPVELHQAPGPSTLDPDGWIASRAGGEVQLLPAANIFESGTTLSVDGRAALDSLLLSLRDEPRLEMELRGLTDARRVRAGSLYRDNEELATRRASIVAEYLVRVGHISSDRIVIRQGREMPERSPVRGVVVRLRTAELPAI
jgi:type VI secretion system protein ImpK